MRKVGLLIISSFLIQAALGQTNPAAQSLPVNISFGTTNFTPPAATMVAWAGSGTRPYATQAAAEASLPGADVAAGVLFNSTPAAAPSAGQYGHVISGNGILTIATSGNSTAGTTQAALAINTLGYTSATISYNLALTVVNPRTVGLVLQYRVGNTGSFTTIAGSAVTYTSGSSNGGDADGPADYDDYIFSLPAGALNQTEVQLRWATWRSGSTGNSSGIGIDDISITGIGGTDILPPTVSSLIPGDDGTNVSTATNLQVTFSEAVAKGLGNIVVKRMLDNSIVQTIDVTNAAVSITGATATITINTLLYNTSYYVEIDAGAFTDIALNNFAGIAGNSTWNFTTIEYPAAGVVGNNYSFNSCASTFITEGWRQYSVTGAQTWNCTTNGRTGADGIQMSGFSGSAITNEDWLISPPFDLTSINLPTLKFYSRGEFTGNDLQLRISSNYVPGANPNTATWTTINGNFPSTTTWTLSDNIDLSAFNTANIFIAWYYTSTNTAAKRWTVDDVTLYSTIVLPPCDEPTDQPTNLTLTPTATTISGSYTAVSPAPSGYLVIRSTSSTLSAPPVDASTYVVGQSIGGGNVVANVNTTSFTDNGLSPTTLYYYFVYAYNNENCTGGPNYNVVVNPAPTGNTNSTTTLALAPCTQPTAAPTVLNLTATNTVVSGSFTASASATNYLVIISTSNSLSTPPVDGVTYTNGTVLGNGTVVTYTTATTFNATGLTISTPYYIYVYAASGDCAGQPDYFLTQLTGTITTTNGTGVPTGYYDPATGLTCQPLKTSLKNIISSGTQVLSYTPGLWNLYSYSDKRRNDGNTDDIVWDMYSDNPSGAEPYTYTLITDQCGSYSIEGDCYNREHSTPQSWFAELSPMVSDAHHIFPTDGKINALHSSYPYGEVQTLSFPSTFNPSLNGSKLGTGSNFGYTGIVFEPINEYKGDFARAALYMAVRYEDEIISQNWSNLGTANAAFLSPTDETVAAIRRLQIYDSWHIQLLSKWHNQDPVSPKEIDRNNVIASQPVQDGAITKVQGNRNPFVDHPEYVAAIWGSGCLTVLPVTITKFFAAKNGNRVIITWSVADEVSIRKYEIERSIDGINFEKIGEVAIVGLDKYALIDNNLPDTKQIYYRLRIVEQNSTYKLSNIVTVKGNERSEAIVVSPNPAGQTITLSFNKALENISTVVIYDVTGRIMMKQEINTRTSSVNINTSSLSNGSYFIKVADMQNVYHSTLIIAK